MRIRGASGFDTLFNPKVTEEHARGDDGGAVGRMERPKQRLGIVLSSKHAVDSEKIVAWMD